MPGTLFVVATPIGNLEDITLRALRILREVAIIAAEDTRRTSHLLARHAIATPTTSLHEHNERQKAPSLIRRLLAGESIAIVSDAGTPGISDPGTHLVRLAIDAGVRVEPVPGPSAIMAALSVMGRQTNSFVFLGFPPVRSKDRQEWLERLSHAGSLAVLFEAPHRIEQTMNDIRAIAGECEVLVGRELTKTHEQLVIGQISDVISRLEEGRGEYTVVVDIGHTQDRAPAERPNPDAVAAEFGEMTKSGSKSRRSAMSALAKRHGISVNEVYSMLEMAKKSIE